MGPSSTIIAADDAVHDGKDHRDDDGLHDNAGAVEDRRHE